MLNQPDFWNDRRLTLDQDKENDEEEVERTLEDYIADLDIALLSLVEPLDVAEKELASLLDSILLSSLWKRTISRDSAEVQALEQALLLSRAEWLWRTTSISQRRACFAASLGRASGVFLYENLDYLLNLLIEFQLAVNSKDGDGLEAAVLQFASTVMQDRFFSARKLPSNWERALASWVRGVAFSQVLEGWGEGERPSVQAFIQDAVVFKLVWAAEAVRVQAQTLDHPGSTLLGDGPALVLTYGVPSIAAALLCQRGFASRVGAVWATSVSRSSFHDFSGLIDWLLENHEQISGREFWSSDDQYLLWKAQAIADGERQHVRWIRRTIRVTPDWQVKQSPSGSRVRIVSQNSRIASVCSEFLEPLGRVKFDFDPRGSFFHAEVLANGDLEVEVFGPP